MLELQQAKDKGMFAKSFNYYSYDKDTYLNCIEMIRSTNLRHATIINTWFLGVIILFMVFASLNFFGVTQEHLPFYTIYLILAIGFELCVWLMPVFSKKHSTQLIYISIAILHSYGILFSVSQPYMVATSYLVLSAVTALSYIDTMYRMSAVSLASCGICIFTSYQFKTFSIAYNDTYNISIVITLMLVLHYAFQLMRIQQFVLFHKNLQIQNELEVKSSFDALTGLLNRGRFFSIAEEVLRQNKSHTLALCLIDLDGFKQINDKLGHQMGDKVIQLTGQTIIKALGLNDVIRRPISGWDLENIQNFAGRLGGDEFIVLVKARNGLDEFKGVFENLLKALNSARIGELNGIQASIGITELASDEHDIDSAYKRADDSLYESKRAGKNQIHYNLCGQNAKAQIADTQNTNAGKPEEVRNV